MDLIILYGVITPTLLISTNIIFIQDISPLSLTSLSSSRFLTSLTAEEYTTSLTFSLDFSATTSFG